MTLAQRVAQLEARLARVEAGQQWAPNRSRAVTTGRLATMRASSIKLWSAVQIAAECGIPSLNATHQWVRGCVGRGELVRVAAGRYRVAP